MRVQLKDSIAQNAPIYSREQAGTQSRTGMPSVVYDLNRKEGADGVPSPQALCSFSTQCICIHVILL